MISWKIKRLRVKIGNRLALQDGHLYIDAHSGLTVKQRLGISLLGGIERLNEKAVKRMPDYLLTLLKSNRVESACKHETRPEDR